MTQFHEGQEVEVGVLVPPGAHHAFFVEWRKATITHLAAASCTGGYHDMPARYAVQFPDGTRAVFDTERIKAIKSDEEKTEARKAVFRKMYHGTD